ncbi:hypothetical protein DFH07DRAFT_938098 [Mycena maculata]|uniref:Nephrocystin 3-like N-terminal domain-containing protein n=1 Tax=Mycena maculata TaxID=230809 RepID=A0AAD7NQN4_9AGAR|nr:hypothetical protein DFH07DRAFT_938098 [Mycena maculata]
MRDIFHLGRHLKLQLRRPVFLLDFDADNLSIHLHFPELLSTTAGHGGQTNRSRCDLISDSPLIRATTAALPSRCQWLSPPSSRNEDPKQLLSKWRRRKGSTVVDPTSIPPHPGASDQHKCGYSVLDNLALALSLAEQVADIAQAAPFIAPAAALLFSNHTILITKASLFIERYDNRGRFAHFAGRNQLGDEIDKLNQELNSFGARFRASKAEIVPGLALTLSPLMRTSIEEMLEKWLRFPPDMTQKQYDTEKLRKEGTGHWFLKGNAFVEKQDNAGSLWIEGPSGAGKSVLSSTVVKQLFAEENLLKDGERSPPAVAFFYFDFGKPKLSAHSPAISDGAMYNHYKLSNRQKLLTYEELCRILRQLLRELGRTYIILDALDECDDTDFKQLVDLVSMLREWAETPLHLCITSQSRQIFTESFEGIPRMALGFDVAQKDIRLFVSDEIQSNPKLKIWRHQADEITDRVAHKSKGMFRRLAACLVIELSYCKWEEEMDETLGNLPDTLFAVYDRFIQRIRPKDWIYAEAVLRWLMFPARRLNPKQLADAISFDFSDPKKYIYKPGRREVNESVMFDRLEGLVNFLLSKQFTIKFGHNLDERISHTFISKTCISLLLYFCNHSLADPARALEAPTSPLAEYAARYWCHHLRFAKAGLLAASARGHVDIVRLLLQRGANIDLRGHLVDGGTGKPALGNVIVGLLERGAEANLPTEAPSSLLELASLTRNMEIVRLLLKSGANPDLRSDHHLSALEHASERGHTEIPDLLLKSGADPNLRSEGCRSALELASFAQDIEMVQLLESGADPNLRGQRYRSALELAILKGNTKVVQLLLENGADAIGNMALHLATWKGDTDIVHLLLDNGADPHLQTAHRRSVIEVACDAGRTEIVPLLLGKGADTTTSTLVDTSRKSLIFGEKGC